MVSVEGVATSTSPKFDVYFSISKSHSLVFTKLTLDFQYNSDCGVGQFFQSKIGLYQCPIHYHGIFGNQNNNIKMSSKLTGLMSHFKRLNKNYLHKLN